VTRNRNITADWRLHFGETRDSFIDRFESMFEKSQGCWIWEGTVDGEGYGYLSMMNRRRRAARVSWELYNCREIPPGMIVLHSCDNPPCINPWHLSIGTQLDNMRDKVSKGRQAKGSLNGISKMPWLVQGENNGSCKFTLEQVEEIRECLRRGEKGPALSKKFGISTSHLSNIRNRRQRRTG
jgi:hypothetical protein